MVRALFYIEALLVAALAALIPFIAADLAWAVFAPLGAALLVPVLAAASVRPLSDLVAAFSFAFLGKRRPGGPAQAALVLEEFAGFARTGAFLGPVASLMAALPKAAASAEPSHLLLLGAFWLLYGLLAAEVATVLKAVVGRPCLLPANQDTEGEAAAAFVGRYGLTPREWEVAARIAGGQSYKETADGLFISVKTVKTHIASVYRKTSTGDKISLVLLLREETRAGKPG